MDKLSEDKYFQTENDLNTYSLSFYPLLEGYGKNFEKAEMLSRDEMSDNMAPSTANNVAAGLHLVPNSNSDGDIGKDLAMGNTQKRKLFPGKMLQSGCQPGSPCPVSS